MSNPLVVWSQEYSVGVKTIDEQHQGLFETINDLWDAIWNGSTLQHLDEIMSKLEQYTVAHFDEEETMMRSKNVPGFEAHKAQHEDFKGHIKAEREKLAATHVPSAELAVYLNGWLIHHIRDMDGQYKGRC